MKGSVRMKRLWILLLVLGMSLPMVAQICEGNAVWPRPGAAPSFLSVITGYHDRPAAATWEALIGKNASFGSDAVLLLRAGKSKSSADKSYKKAGDLRTDSAQALIWSPSDLVDFESYTWACVEGSTLESALSIQSDLLRLPDSPIRCRVRMSQLLVRYLQTYAKETPVSSHFNGGFYNYLSDSLHWDPKKPDGNGYLMALNVVVMAMDLDPKRHATYLELLGDLLSKEPNRFTANYLSCLAYLRAGMVAGGSAQAAYDRKALFAIEAPRQAEERFNQYRFTQLKKALQADVDSAAARRAKTETEEKQAIKGGTDPLARFQGKVTNGLISTTFTESDPGQLPAILKKSKEQQAARELEAKRYAGDVDLKKEVKKDVRFNAFAVFLIAIIIGAVIFIWVKIMRASKAS
ncbi:MAG: hypothetical protein U0176_26600 [Bacteroidia bacterium]